MNFRTTLSLVCLALPLLASSAAAAPGPPDANSPNVQLTIRLGATDKGASAPVRSYQLVLEGAGEHTEMVVGARVAIPTTKFEASDGGVASPVTSFTYQNIGFTAAGRAWVLDDGQVRIDVGIEDSHLLDEPTVGSQPKIGTRHQSLRAVLRPGVPLVVNRIDDPTLGSGYCEVVAEVLE